MTLERNIKMQFEAEDKRYFVNELQYKIDAQIREYKKCRKDHKLACPQKEHSSIVKTSLRTKTN